jgi:hypothetical protein
MKSWSVVWFFRGNWTRVSSYSLVDYEHKGVLLNSSVFWTLTKAKKNDEGREGDEQETMDLKIIASRNGLRVRSRHLPSCFLPNMRESDISRWSLSFRHLMKTSVDICWLLLTRVSSLASPVLLRHVFFQSRITLLFVFQVVLNHICLFVHLYSLLRE